MSSTRPAKRVLLPHDAPLTDGDVRKFGVVMLIGFGLIGGLVRWLGSPNAAIVLWSIGGFLGLPAIVVPRAWRPVRAAWMAGAGVLGRINTVILLSLFYFLVVTPFALVFRLFGRDVLRLRKREATTYWEPKRLPSDPKAYFNQF